jgi:hypothetical protein
MAARHGRSFQGRLFKGAWMVIAKYLRAVIICLEITTFRLKNIAITLIITLAIVISCNVFFCLCGDNRKLFFLSLRSRKQKSE